MLFTWLLTFAAVTLLGSTLARSTSAAAGIALGGSVLLWLGGSLPSYGTLFPSGLVGWAAGLGVSTPIPPNGGALAFSLVLMMICLVAAAFEVEEL